MFGKVKKKNKKFPQFTQNMPTSKSYIIIPKNRPYAQFMSKQQKYAKTRTVQLCICTAAVMKGICVSLSVFFLCDTVNTQMH